MYVHILFYHLFNKILISAYIVLDFVLHERGMREKRHIDGERDKLGKGKILQDKLENRGNFSKGVKSSEDSTQDRKRGK